MTPNYNGGAQEPTANDFYNPQYDYASRGTNQSPAMPRFSLSDHSPIITDFSRATHDHSTTAKGGPISAAGLDNPYKFSVQLIANVTIPSGIYTRVLFDSTVFDTNKNFDTTTGNKGVYTVPISGFYQLNANISMGGGVGAAHLIELWKNGSQLGMPRGSQISADLWSGLNVLMQFKAGDFIEIVAFQNSGGATAINGTTSPYLTHFSGFLMSVT